MSMKSEIPSIPSGFRPAHLSSAASWQPLHLSSQSGMGDTTSPLLPLVGPQKRTRRCVGGTCSIPNACSISPAQIPPDHFWMSPAHSELRWSTCQDRKQVCGCKICLATLQSMINGKLIQVLALLRERAHQDCLNYAPKPMRGFQVSFPLLLISVTTISF